MFGKNPILGAVAGNGKVLRIVNGSPFLTIQGEGPYAGHPAVFIRLHGCNLACTFCDTDFSDPKDPEANTLSLTLAARKLSEHAKLAVITGGEPLRQPIIELCIQLQARGFTAQIETAGTLWQDGLNLVSEIVCSPKTPKIHSKIYEHARAFKYVIDHRMRFGDDPDFPYVPVTATQAKARPALLARPRPDAPVYLSPMDTYDDQDNARNKRLVAEMAVRCGVIAGCQLHKVLDVEEPR